MQDWRGDGVRPGGLGHPALVDKSSLGCSSQLGSQRGGWGLLHQLGFPQLVGRTWA